MFEGMAAFVIVMVLLGLFLGLTASEAKVLTPKTSGAKQRQMDETTRHKAELNRIEEQKLAAVAELEFEQKRAEAAVELESFKQESELKLMLWEFREKALTAAGVVALVIVAVSVAVMFVLLGYRWSGMAQKATQSIYVLSEDVWRSRAYRDARIQIARSNERDTRKKQFAKQSTQAPSVSGDNGHCQEAVPFWGSQPESAPDVATKDLPLAT